MMRIRMLSVRMRMRFTFKGEPFNLDFLKSYKTHVTYQVWKSYMNANETCRGILKTYHPGIAFNKEPKYYHKYIKGRVELAGLDSLMICNLPLVDGHVVDICGHMASEDVIFSYVVRGDDYHVG